MAEAATSIPVGIPAPAPAAAAAAAAAAASAAAAGPPQQTSSESGPFAIGQMVESQDGRRGRVQRFRAGFVIVQMALGEEIYRRAYELSPLEGGLAAQPASEPSGAAAAAAAEPADRYSM